MLILPSCFGTETVSCRNINVIYLFSCSLLGYNIRPFHFSVISPAQHPYNKVYRRLGVICIDFMPIKYKQNITISGSASGIRNTSYVIRYHAARTGNNKTTAFIKRKSILRLWKSWSLRNFLKQFYSFGLYNRFLGRFLKSNLFLDLPTGIILTEIKTTMLNT
jgi:hypothetical protein